jgi:hypothetical protein
MKWTGTGCMERSSNNTDPQEGRSRRHYKLASDFNSNCVCRIFTRWMAQTVYVINLKGDIESDSQKGFIKTGNGCNEYGIMLNELLRIADRNRENLAVMGIDSRNTFRWVPQELVMSIMRERNVPPWTRKITERTCRGMTSTIELKGNETEKIAWKRGVKQGCRLSPLLFGLCLELLLKAAPIGCE